MSGTEVPANSYFTNTGNVATEPDDAYSALPFGEYKGFALSLFIEIMTTSLLGGATSKTVIGESVETSDAHGVTRGGMILVIDPSLMTNLPQFKETNSVLVEKITKSERLPNATEIRVPGERALQNRAQNLKDGFLEIDEQLWDRISAG